MKSRIFIVSLILAALAISVILIVNSTGNSSGGNGKQDDTGAFSVNTEEIKSGNETPEISEKGPSRLDFLKTARAPAGQTMYVWGGGWNEEDTGAGEEARTLGVSGRWKEFYLMQDSSYNFENTRYQIHDGLDCSGFVGWAVYNTLEKENGREGYVFKSTDIASELESRGLGDALNAQESDFTPGDIVSMNGHAWISVGKCDDGSALILHCSPPGVFFCGTLLPDGSESEAAELAQSIMKTQYPEWYEKFPSYSAGYYYLTDINAVFHWSSEVLCDPEGISYMKASEAADLIFSESGADGSFSSDTGNERLNSLLDGILSEITNDTMSDREKAYAIYTWVENNIRYSGNTPMDGWVNGAISALETGKGNCYAYYSASAALLTRAGIRNIEIYETGREHVWNLVMIDGKWYHFDTTTGWGSERFLWTDAQMEAYSYYNETLGREISYEWDHDAFPKSAE